ncbi:MAG: DNA repair protein RecN [Coriobacteriia bacterium]|nr:DNA repair protein RecN [Coriobacteriia bacterium]
MLEEIHVRNLALIDDAWIEFSPGMTVLTGETGAGKTALVGALKLLVGERADSGMVRSDADEALVEGRFAADSTEIVARRRVSADGRSRCTIDGVMATVGELARTLGPLVDLHGQHEHQALLIPARHVTYLDRYIGEDALAAVDVYRQARGAYLEAIREYESLAQRLADVSRKADYLSFVLGEIEAVDPQPDEDIEIERRLPALQHAEKLSAAARQAASLVRDDDRALDALGAALDELRRVEGLDSALDRLTTRLDALATELNDASAELRAYAQGVEHDPAALDDLQARVAALAGLKKKYGPSLALVFDTRDDARTHLAEMESGDDELAEAQQRIAVARGALEVAAEALAELRCSHALAFTDALEHAIDGLNMAGARFEVALEMLEVDDWGLDGPQRVEFLFSPAVGEVARPLGKIASGGEISRVMLALKSVLGAADDVPVLVFDEIDAGIGGATALAVGARLAALAGARQVIVVTHLAQVAAFATRHLVVEKSVAEGRTVTAVKAVEGELRVAEIARMLSGGDSDTGRAHALELLEQVAASTAMDAPL